MKYEKILSKLGLSEVESIIYLDLLSNASSNILEISNRTKLNRPLIYKTIPYLVETGLVSSILKGKRSYYKAESPEHLKNLFEKLNQSFNNLMPELEDIYSSKDVRPNIKLLDGKKGIRQIFEDIVTTLNKGDTYYRYSSRQNFKDRMLPTNYWELRDKKEIQRLVITSEIRAKEKGNKLNRDVVYIPAGYDMFDDNVSKMIYGNKIAIIDYTTNSGFIIENAILARFEEKIFKMMYKFLKNLENID